MTDIVPQRRSPTRQFPLHAKDVPTMDFDRLLALPMRAEYREALRDALRWCHDWTLYEPILEKYITRTNPRLPRPTALNREDIEVLIQLDRYTECGDDEVLAWCNVFTRTELQKARRRHILEPLINDVISPEDFQHFTLVSHQDVCANLKRYAIQFDASSFYDQFALAPAVQRMMGIKQTQGASAFTFSRLPMGFKPSCVVAQAAMTALADCSPDDTAWTAVYIDNVLFTADDQNTCAEFATRFLARAHEANITINDPPADIHTAVTEDYDFLGAHYATLGPAWTDWTRRNTAKTVEKLEAAQGIIAGRITFRQLAAVTGLLLFAHSIRPQPLAEYYEFFTFFRGAMRVASQKWNGIAPTMSSTALAEVQQWLVSAIANAPAPIRSHESTPEFTLWVDASSTGWGAMAMGPTDVRFLGAAWSPSDHAVWNLRSSVIAEPLALKRAVLAVASTRTTHIQIFTDHKPLSYAMAAGYGRCRAYNDCIKDIQQMFPRLRLSTEWIAGVANVVADDLSRRNWREERVAGELGHLWVPRSLRT